MDVRSACEGVAATAIAKDPGELPVGANNMGPMSLVMFDVSTLYFQLHDVTVVAGAGMVFEANKRAIRTGGLSFTLGARVPISLTSSARAPRQGHPVGLTMATPPARAAVYW